MQKECTCAMQKWPVEKMCRFEQVCTPGAGGVGGRWVRAELGRALKTLVRSSGLLCALENH